MMSEQRIGGGTNSRPLNDTIAESGPGIPDEALAPGQDLPEMPDDQEVERVAKKLGADRKLSGNEGGG
jgi:hypothetical protein